MKSCPTCQSSYPDSFTVCPQDGALLQEIDVWAEGSVIRGKYRLLAKVGQGGMGAVYKALHLAFDELRAIKVIAPELLSDELFVKRFKHEAVITRKLQHPNAVRVDDIDEAEDGRPFIVMEFIEGESLKKLIRDEGPIAVPRVCSIIKQAAEALDAAHRLGMVHRDIKPENISLVKTPDGEMVKVLDFGIAKVKEARAGESQGMTLTGKGVVIGTPQYMSPEQAMGKRGDELDGRADLYSLGIVMYQMLTADLPFKAETTMEMLLAHMQRPPAPIWVVHPELNVPQSVAILTMRLLEKNRDMRPASARALIREIEKAEKEMGGGEAVGSTRVVSPEYLTRAPRGGAAAGSVSPAAGGQIPSRPQPPQPPYPPMPPIPRPAEQSRAAQAQAPRPQPTTALPTPPPPPVQSPPSLTPHTVYQPQPVAPPQPAYQPPPIAPAPPVMMRPQPVESRWGMWVALVVLIVGLGVGALWMATRRSAPIDHSAPPVLSARLDADPASVEKGKSTTLKWSSQNATELDLEPGVGKVEASGSMSVSPAESTDYTLTATGLGGKEVATTRVDVTQRTQEITTQNQETRQVTTVRTTTRARTRQTTREVIPPPPPPPSCDQKKVQAAITEGKFYFSRGEYKPAIAAFEEGLRTCPSNTELSNWIQKTRSVQQTEEKVLQ